MVSLHSCIVHALEKELLDQVPLDPTMVRAKWREAWEQGDESVAVEVAAVALDKDDNFNVVKDIAMFRTFVDEHQKKNPVKSLSLSTNEGAIDCDKFDLTMKQLKYDEAAFETWQKKCAGVFVARHCNRR